MKLVVISHPEKIEDEEKIIPHLIDNGLEYFHLRKPDWIEGLIVSLIKKIPAEYHKKIIIHNHWDLMHEFNLGGIHVRETEKHLISDNRFVFHSVAVHRTNELYQLRSGFNYALLSPVFNSISKINVKAAFDLEKLKTLLTEKHPEVPVYALGGINQDNIIKAKEIGFEGAAILGFIWDIYKKEGLTKTISSFKKLQQSCL